MYAYAYICTARVIVWVKNFYGLIRSTLNPVDTANGPVGVADRAKMDSEVCAVFL